MYIYHRSAQPLLGSLCPKAFFYFYFNSFLYTYTTGKRSICWELFVPRPFLFFFKIFFVYTPQVSATSVASSLSQGWGNVGREDSESKNMGLFPAPPVRDDCLRSSYCVDEGHCAGVQRPVSSRSLSLPLSPSLSLSHTQHTHTHSLSLSLFSLILSLSRARALPLSHTNTHIHTHTTGRRGCCPPSTLPSLSRTRPATQALTINILLPAL